ncbi:MAG: septum formation protein Maf [Muribaculaceae bacterium]|nr:septum formation protein Maf [Muribaculaceae bacterium]
MLLLASKSPRRRELLKLLNVDFRIVEGPEVEEVYPADLPVEEVPAFLSSLKAEAFRPTLAGDDILVTADTVVVLDNEIIGKPASLDDAKRMLHRLSGRTHRVITGVSLTSARKSETFSVVTEVFFAPLTPADIDFYVDTYKPLDKAGAYGIQEWIGAVGVEGVRGSFYNVMGLPVHQLYHHLKSFSSTQE